MIPSVNERIGNMSEMRNQVCERLPLNHPFPPQIIQPLNMVPPEVNVEISSSSSQPSSTKPTQETSMLDNLVSHYSGELPEVRPITMEVTLESPLHQAPNQQMTTTTSYELVSSPEHVVPEHAIPEHAIPETVSEPDFMITSDAFDVEMEKSFSTMVIQSVPDKPSTSNTQTPNSTNNQPSSSHLAIVLAAPTKPTKIPSPPTIFLDSTLLTDVCEKIFQELNKLIQARNDLIHQDKYEKQWCKFKERVDYIMSAVQTTCSDAQDIAQQKLQD
jgi:hypothetical protein